MATGNPPKRLMVWMKSRRASNEGHTKGGEAERGAVPVAAGIEERDERGQHAVADAAQRQAHAVRRNTAQHVAEGKMLAVDDRNGRLAEGQARLMAPDNDGEQADGSQAPLAIENDAQRRAQGHGAIGADAVEGDDLGGAFLAGAGDAPQR